MGDGDKAAKKPETNNKTEEEKTELVSCFFVVCLKKYSFVLIILQSEEDRLLQEELAMCVERLAVSRCGFNSDLICCNDMNMTKVKFGRMGGWLVASTK